MGAALLPPGLLALEPVWRNFTENMATVQFNHRLLAMTTFTVIVIYRYRSRQANLPPKAVRASKALLHTGVLQIVLGISTLLLAVPTLLAVTHQAVALLLLTVALFLAHSLRRAPA
jgi:cytochrome c oxidase assembly protein subunit 15